MGSSTFRFTFAKIVTATPRTKKAKYGASLPKNSEIKPALIGPIAQPIPNVVSYAPIIVPDISFLVLLRIISNVSGKNILNPYPISSSARANSKIVCDVNATIRPNDIEIVAVIRVTLVFLASFPANIRVAVSYTHLTLPTILLV